MISKNFKKIIMSFIMIFAFCIGINVNAQDYALYANGVQFSDDNLTVQCGDGTATFDPSTKTLTLNNATITESADGMALVTDEMADDVLNVVLIGNNILDGSDSTPPYDGFDVISEGINIAGTGTLTMNHVMFGIYSEDEATVTTSGITLNITPEEGGQAIVAGTDITFVNSTITINSEVEVGAPIESTDAGTITVTNSNVTVNSIDTCINLAGTAPGRKFVLNSGMVILNSEGGNAIGAQNPENASIVINGGTLRMNGSNGGTYITNITIPGGHARTKGNDYTSQEVEIAPAITVSGNIAWIDDDNAGSTRPSSVYLMIKNPGGQTVAQQEVKASQNWAYSMQVAMNDDSGNPINYTLVVNGADGYNPLIAGYNVTLILDGMSTDEVFPSLTTFTKVIATGTILDLEGQPVDTEEYESELLTGDVQDSTVANIINEYKDSFNTWAAENDATGSTTSESITSLYFQSDQVGDTHYTSMDDLVQAYKNNGGSGVLNVNKVQTYTMVYQGTKNPEREKTTIAGQIVWQDSANQDGKRPASLTVSIKNGATLVESQTVTADNNWAYSFEGLFVQDLEGNNITYTLEGSALNGYEISLDGNNLVYSHTPEKTTISGTLTWNDNNNALGLRPDNVTITLYKNGIVQDTQTKESGMYIFANLDKFSGGSLAEYTIQVSNNENYISTLDGYNITMNCKKQIISGTITWDDDDNVNGSRPLEVQVQLKANGETVETKTLSSVTNWKFNSTVDKYDSSNNEITYTAAYPNVDDYDKSVSGLNATYTYAVTTVNVTGKVNWEDDGNRDGIRPNRVVVTLYNGSEVVTSKYVDASSNWNYDFSGLNKKDNQGQTINYTVQAQTGIDGYELTSSGTNFTYTHTPERINITGTITWNDNNNQDNIRPDSVTVQLKNGNSVVKEATAITSAWTYAFANVYKYENGSQINYTLAPKQNIPRYTYEQSGNNLIFAHTHEVITVEGSITWNDNNDQDGFRPTSLEVGVYVGSEKVRFTEVSDANNWTYSFPDLDKLDNEGNNITYTIKSEENLPGYTYATSGYNIVYSHLYETVDVTGTISWNDNDDALGLRPETVKVTLLANDEESKTVNVSASNNWNFSFNSLPKYAGGSEVTYTVTTQSFDSYRITSEGNTFNYECSKIKVSGQVTFEDNSNQDGIRPNNMVVSIKNGSETVKEVTISSSTNWKFSELVNKYDGDDLITYTVSYPNVDDYEKTTSGNNATYTHTPEKTSVSGTIKFVDNDNQDQIRPSKVTINLKNGSTTVDSKEFNITGETTSFEFTNVDKYSGGEEIAYTFEGASVSDYEVSTSGTVVTYTHAIATTRVEGKITWNDASNQDGKRPNQVVVTLNTGATKTVTAADDWEFSFTGLPKYDNGDLIEYSVSVPEVDEYESSKDGYNITYSHTPEKTTLTGKIIFEDANNQDNLRPTKVTLNIDNGSSTITREITVEGNTTNYSIADLAKYSGGEEITYTVTGQTISKYEMTKSGNDITYTHTPDTVTVSGRITFEDNSNQDGKRPNEVVITLSNGDTATANAASSWRYEFKDLPKNNAGTAISYTITAPDVADYTKEVNGNNVTYTHQKETITLNGTVTFDDENDKYGFRPDEITVTIKNGSTTVKTVKVKESNSWSYNVTVDKYASGEEINYTISTNSVSNYKIINNSPNFTYKCTKVKLTVKAKFVDNDDEAGLRPDKVNIDLYGNSGKVSTVELTSSKNYSKTVTVDRYASDDTEIAYTITPETIDSYEVSSTDTEATYTYNGEAKKKVSGKITWNDASSSTRPSSVTVVLYQNGVEYSRISVTKNDDWKYTFRGLPKEDSEGLELTYTVSVESVNGYTSSIDGNNVILDKINYRIIEGNGQLFVISEDSGAEFRINGDYDLFKDLYIDKKLVDKANYSVREGSTIITLKDSFTKSLTSGKHSIKVTFKDGGEASGNFLVQRTSTEESMAEIINPTTGDKIVLYIILLVSSSLGIFVIRKRLGDAN